VNLSKLPYYPNILLISGTGRNVGKTSFAVSLIRRHRNLNITAVKISPHFHEFDAEKEDVLYKSDNVIIIEEHQTDTGKDSAKFLDAGAARVLFIMVQDSYLPQAFRKLLEIVNPKNPMIIESGAMRNILIPGQFLLFSHANNTEIKNSIKHLLKFVDRRVKLNHNAHDLAIEKLNYTTSGWQIDS